jgi:hypothetical protein
MLRFSLSAFSPVLAFYICLFPGEIVVRNDPEKRLDFGTDGFAFSLAAVRSKKFFDAVENNDDVLSFAFFQKANEFFEPVL